MRVIKCWWVLAGAILSHSQVTTAAPLRLDPDNPHYFLFRGRPTVLIGATEHGGSVINSDFNYTKYLDSIAKAGLNVTRIFSGQYRERPGPFAPTGPASGLEIRENTLAPDSNSFVAPWKRSGVPGALDGKNKFDLTKWNEAYFERLKDFVKAASDRGIVVEVTLFSPYYTTIAGNWLWDVSPLNATNNINGVGSIDGADSLTMKDRLLVRVEDEFVRRIVAQLRNADNIYYDICNEPYAGNVSREWQSHIAQVIADAEGSPANRHLIAQEFVNEPDEAPVRNDVLKYYRNYFSYTLRQRLPSTDIFVSHNIFDPRFISDNYPLERPLGQDETIGVSDAANRAIAWRLMMAGSSVDIVADYSFTRGHEAGDFIGAAGRAGAGSAELRRQLSFLLSFMKKIDFVKMRPFQSLVVGRQTDGRHITVLGQAAKTYLVYIDHLSPVRGWGHPPAFDNALHEDVLTIHLPRGRYTINWTDPKSGYALPASAVITGGTNTLRSPKYGNDILLQIRRD